MGLIVIHCNGMGIYVYAPGMEYAPYAPCITEYLTTFAHTKINQFRRQIHQHHGANGMGFEIIKHCKHVNMIEC